MTRPFFTSETRRLGSIRDAVPLQVAIPGGVTDLLLSAGRRTVRTRLAETFDPNRSARSVVANKRRQVAYSATHHPVNW